MRRTRGLLTDLQVVCDVAFENFRLFGAPHVAIVTTDRALGVCTARSVAACIWRP